MLELKLASLLGLDYVKKVADATKERRKASLRKYKEELKTQKGSPESDAFEKLISKLSDDDIRNLMREIDSSNLQSALKLCGYETIDKILSNLTEKISEMILEGMRQSKPSTEYVISKQNEIIATWDRIAYPQDM